MRVMGSLLLSCCDTCFKDSSHHGSSMLLFLYAEALVSV